MSLRWCLPLSLLCNDLQFNFCLKYFLHFIVYSWVKVEPASSETFSHREGYQTGNILIVLPTGTAMQEILLCKLWNILLCALTCFPFFFVNPAEKMSFSEFFLLQTFYSSLPTSLFFPFDILFFLFDILFSPFDLSFFPFNNLFFPSNLVFHSLLLTSWCSSSLNFVFFFFSLTEIERHEWDVPNGVFQQIHSTRYYMMFDVGPHFRVKVFLFPNIWYIGF